MATGLNKSCLVLLCPLQVLTELSSPLQCRAQGLALFQKTSSERPDSWASGINTSKMFPHHLTGDSRQSCLEHLGSRGHRAVLSAKAWSPEDTWYICGEEHLPSKLSPLAQREDKGRVSFLSTTFFETYPFLKSIFTFVYRLRVCL